MKALIFMLIFAISVIDNSLAQQELCDYKVEILLNNTEFQSKDFSWRMKATKIEGMPTNITGTAEIDDLIGQIIKKYKPWTNESISKQKTSSVYSPNLKEGQYKIIAEINVGCEDTNKNNNVDVKIIKIKGEKNEIVNNAQINADYKEKTAESNKVQNNESIKNESLNQQNKIIQSKNSSQDEEIENIIQFTKSKKQGNEQSQLTGATIKETKIVYESSNEKAKNLIMVSLLALSILLNIILIWRR